MKKQQTKAMNNQTWKWRIIGRYNMKKKSNSNEEEYMTGEDVKTE